MSQRDVTGLVALVEDDYTLVINRGAHAGVAPGMLFAVYSNSGQVITDPETGRELGRLRREEVRVRVFEVHPLFSRAHTYIETDDFYGLLQLPSAEHSGADVVTVNVGDTVAQVHSERPEHQAKRSGT